MKNKILIILFLGLCLSVNAQTKLIPYVSSAGDSSGYVSESNLWATNISSDAPVWKVGGNNVSGASILGTNSNHDLIFRTNSTERMKIDANGFVAINTPISAFRLDVGGAIRASSTIYTSEMIVDKPSASGKITLLSAVGNPSTIYFYNGGVYRGEFGNTDGNMLFNPTVSSNFYVNGSLKMFLNNTGLGVGTSSPSSTLHVNGNARIVSLPSSARTDSTVTRDASGNLRSTNSLTLYDFQTSYLKLPTGASNNYVLKSDASGNASWAAANTLETDPKIGSLTTNYLPKWNGTTLANTQVFDDGTNIGIGNTSPTEKLSVTGNASLTGNVVIGGDFSTSTGKAVIGNTQIKGNFTSPTRFEILVGDGTGWYGACTNGVSQVIKLYDNGNADFSGTVIAANATSGTHLLNRNTADARYLMLGGQNGSLTVGSNDNNTFSLKQNNEFRQNIYQFNTEYVASYTHTVQNSTSTKPTLSLFNSGVSTTNVSDIFVANNINTTLSSMSNGAIVLSPESNAIAVKAGNKRMDVAYGVNGRIDANISLTGDNDTATITIADTIRNVRVYKGSAVTTSKVKFNLPASPQNNYRLTVFVVTDPTSITFVKTGSGQSFMTATNFPTTGSGDVYEVYFLSSSFQSEGGEWFIKKL